MIIATRVLIIITIIIITILPSYAVDGIRISVSPKEVEFNLVNPIGLITGYTPNGIFNQIKEVDDYALWGSPSTDISDNPYDKRHVINQDGYPAYVSPGKYRLNIYGTTLPTQAKISVEYWWINQGLKGPRYNNFHLIYPNVIWAYEFDVGTTLPANNQIILTKISTPTDLIKDITIAGQLGYIGNAHFVSDTIEKINEIEEKRLKPAEKDDDHKLTPAQKAKKEYTELLKDITEKYNKPEGDEFVKQEAYTVLKEDLEYIINHIQ